MTQIRTALKSCSKSNQRHPPALLLAMGPYRGLRKSRPWCSPQPGDSTLSWMTNQRS
jgi:hypothetical protein